MIHNRKDYRNIYDKIDFNEASEFFSYSKGKYSSIIRYQEFNEIRIVFMDAPPVVSKQ